MASYRCPECHELTDQPTCPQCVVATTPISEPPPPPPPPPEEQPLEAPSLGPAMTIPIAVAPSGHAPQDQAAAAPEPPRDDPWSRADAAWSDGSSQSLPEPLLQARLHRTQELPEAPPPQRRPRPVVAEAGPRAALDGQEQVEADLAEGYELYMVIGTTSSGKTQLLEAYERLTPGYLDQYKRADGKVSATTPDTITSRRMSVDGRKVAFIDAAGEQFVMPFRKAASPTDTLVQAMAAHRLVAETCAGVVLVIDVKKLWEGDTSRMEQWGQQIEIAAWNLEILRWLRFDGIYPDNCPIPLGQYIDRQVRKLDRRLDCPVLVLFTKADELAGQRIEGRGRSVVPAGESPLFLACHCFPSLHGALLRHANHFRYDFVHSIVTDPETGVVVEGAPPCGVGLAFSWLLDPSWRWPLPKVRTRHWLSLQRLVDTLTLRGRRWHRLQRPRRLPR